MKDTVLEIKGIYKEFKVSKKQQKILKINSNNIVAVNDVSFKLFKGEIFCLLGTNGAGKTTTLRMAAGLMKPQKGEVIIYDGRGRTYEKERKKKIGFLTSELKLEDAFTPNYLFDYFGKLYQMEKGIIESRKKMLFEKFGIGQFAEVKIKNLSTGMKQKVSLAIALVHNPEIIIFDEPTNGLDIVTSREIISFLKELKMEGKSIIISTHIFDVVEKLADTIGIMVNGRMVRIDSYHDILQIDTIENVFYEEYLRWRNKVENPFGIDQSQICDAGTQICDSSPAAWYKK